MSFKELALMRQSTRSYDPTREVEEEKLMSILECGRLAPSACNGQPYHFTVCRGESAAAVAGCVTGLGMNKFAKDAPVLIVVSEEPYVASAAFGARVKKNDYRSIDIGIAAAYLTAECASQGLGSCILGWFDNEKIKSALGIDGDVRLVITVGHPKSDDLKREKKRKNFDEIVAFK